MTRTLADNPAFGLEVQDGIATLRFRKAFLSVILNLHTRGEFLGLLGEIESDPTVQGLVEINDEQFAGEDEISALMRQLTEPSGGRMSVLHRFKRSTLQIMSQNLDFPKPLVSGVIGNVTLDEFGLALISDRVLLSDECVVRNVAVEAGLPPHPILTFFLPRVVGPKRAVTLLTRSEPLAAPEAVELGLADRLVPAAEVEDACRAAVQQLAKLPGPVVSSTRSQIFSQFDNFEEHADRAINQTVQILQSRDW